MRAGIRSIRLILFAAVLLCAAAETRAADSYRHGQYSTVVGEVRDSVFTLPHSWIISDSTTVSKNGTLLAQFSQWNVLDPGNRIWIFVPVIPGDTIAIEYLYRPAPIYRSFFRRSLRDVRMTASDSIGIQIIEERVDTESGAGEGWSRLNKSGSLIRSVQVGTGSDLELESALNLQIDGRVGRDIEVVAALTDQNTPIQPEGTTESINELEKVFVSVKHPNWTATIGDYVLELPGGAYDSYDRKLTGVMGELRVNQTEAELSGAASDGEFFSNSFSGIESVQGPYTLRGKNGESGIVVLAGTESVWLNGIQLRRGEGNDYVIEYGSGAIMFTSRRIITSDSRILVDFQYTNEDYNRTFGAGRVTQRIENDVVNGSVTWITESDDRSRPINRTIDTDEAAILRESGDDPNLAVEYSADSVGTNAGDYVRTDTLVDGTSHSIFEYVGRDSLDVPQGNWQVLFDDFGENNGDYSADADIRGRTFFRWVGENNGRYRSYKRLPLPEQQTLADVRLSTSPAAGLRIGGEIAMSDLDRNTYSELDDADNDGVAIATNADFVKAKPNLLGIRPHQISLSASLRGRNQEFREMTRGTDVEFSREWDAEVNRGTEEVIWDSRATIAPVRPLSISGGVGSLRRDGVQNSDRYTTGMRYNPSKFFSGNVNHLQIFSDDSLYSRKGNWIRQHGDAGSVLGIFSPRLGVDRERKRNSSDFGSDGFRILEFRGGSGVELPHDFSFDGEYSRRTEEKLISDGNFEDSTSAYNVSGEAAWRPQGAGWTIARFTHREKSSAGTDSADIVTDVGRIESLIAPRNRVVEANVSYEVSKTRSQNQILVAIQVTPGTGTHRREGDIYVSDDQGDYILVPRNSGTFEPATELRLNSQIWIRPDELDGKKLAPWIHALSGESEVQIEERSRYRLTPELILLSPRLLQGDSTLNGNASFRQDVHVNRLSRRLSFRVRYRSLRSLDNQLLNGGEKRTRDEGGLRVRAQYSQNLRGETEAAVSRETFEFQTAAFTSRDIKRSSISQETTYSFSRKLDFSLRLSAEEADDERTHTQASLKHIVPHAGYNVLSKGRLDGEFTWVHAGSNKAVIPFEIANGANRGENFRWSLRGTYQFGQNFSSSLAYTGRQDSGEQTFHTGRLEVRATF